MRKQILLFHILFSILLVGCREPSLHLSETYGDASVNFDGEVLIVNTGKFERSWKITQAGMVTTSLKNSETGKVWAGAKGKICDWEYFGLINENTKASLVGGNVVQSSDSGFTSEHLLVELEFEYRAVETFVKYEIRAYPGAQGLYTRIALKGNPSKHIEKKFNVEGVKFNLISGKEKYDYATHGVAEDYIANFATDKERVEYLIEGLDKENQYKIGLSWWDFLGQGMKQNVIVSSVDGERKREVAVARKVSNYKNNKEQPEEIVFDLPQDVLLDGSFRLIINNAGGSAVTLSEIWMQEKSEKDYYIAGNVDRVKVLRSALNDNWSLCGYANCGERNKAEVSSITGRVDHLPVNAKQLTRKYIGYYNDTQHRNRAETPLVKEETIYSPVSEKENVEWASVLFVEDGNDVLILVKESHKCVNQYGYDTGDFEISEQGISNTGTSLSPIEVLSDRYRYSWATWTVLGVNTPEEQNLALKTFDRIRYPVDKKRDIYIQANTWGSGRNKQAASEDNILKEIEVQAELGIDVQQIDDGWQAKQDWKPKGETYPQGWENVKEKAQKFNIELGLWAAAMPVTLEQLKWNYDKGGFVSYKLDFARLNNHKQIEEMISKIRQFILYTEQKVRVNWDVTENAPRYGYYWAREYGCVYLENRKLEAPENVIYHPYLVLRDLWHLSKYTNLNKFQGTVQNIDMVNRDVSDAFKHNHAYVTTISLMSTPLFFQETQFYSQEAKDEIKPVLAAYKEVREEIYESFVFPVGEEPDNSSWAGFQAHHPSKKIGYLNLFREIGNAETTKNIQLKFLKNQEITFTDLLRGESFKVKSDELGFVVFEIEKACDFRMFKYAY